MTDRDRNLTRIDLRRRHAAEGLSGLRDRMAPSGDVVSPAGRQRTRKVFGKSLAPVEVVTRICGDVRRLGIQAVLDYTARLDAADLTPETLRVPVEQLAAAHASAEPAFLETIRRVRQNIVRFQTALLHRDVEVPIEEGGYLRQRYVPLERVGICVPGGSAAYPSTILMTAIPAQAAGVRELAVMAPPTDFGANHPQVLATCHELGITEVYRMGGAQGVAALAYGVDGVPAVDKIVGPGNLFVALAKKHVYGDVDIDSIAGPSEVVVIADETLSPKLAAADLIAQAEHSPGASVLISWCPSLLDDVPAHLNQQLAALPRGDLAAECLQEFGALIHVEDADQAATAANFLAPEHLQIVTRDAEQIVSKIVHAGAIFVGPYSPVPLGDYAAGPSHVLPTGGTARFASGLSANDFLRSGSVIHCSRAAMQRLAADVQVLANVEGLTAHWRCVEARLGDGEAP